ncbi:MAG TPA: SDR family NAD(P)-dependent oxidoreductase [Anaerolineae bacterium]|nr:SDR family NAD(P)-dependent oxidoreductase [Anaerolineae bacterium]
MKIVITGAGGFIGSHVVETALERGHDVTALVHYNSNGSWGFLENSSHKNSPHLSVQLGDVTDRGQMDNLVTGADVILHLAALIGIPYSYQAPNSYVQTNIIGTLNMLQAAQRAQTSRIVITSTSEVYGSAQYVPIDEKHPLQGQSPYSASKIGADKLAESYYCSFDLPVVTLRPFNTYGPRQSARAIIPTILSQALQGADTIKLGNLSPKRDLTFVKDTAKAFLLAAETPNIEGEVIHFGQGKSVTMGELAQTCLDVVGSSAQIVSQADRMRPEKSEVQHLECDARKAHQLLGWQPDFSLAAGLEACADYTRQNLHLYKAAYNV